MLIFTLLTIIIANLVVLTGGQMVRSTSECVVPRCAAPNVTSNGSCLSNSSPVCYSYTAILSNQIFCAPSFSCILFDPCLDDFKCLSNSSICLSSTCCSRPVCVPLALAVTGCSGLIINAIDPCGNKSRCLNNGTCQVTGDRGFCLCAPLYYGTSCEYRGSGTDLSELGRILNGTTTSYDRTVENVLNRTNWTNSVAVVDVTGSMTPCAAAVYKWLSLASNRTNLIKYYVFFNDGDEKDTSAKVIGSTGGLYGIPTTDLNTVLAAMQTAMRNGNGGDGPENDIEAILYGIQLCPTCSNVIHIADNQVTPRDMSLLSRVTKPVKTIICQLNGNAVNADLVNIAARTSGSIHTLQQDIFDLAGIAVGGTITIGSYTYRRTATGYTIV